MDNQSDVRTRELADEPMRSAGPKHGFFGGTMESIRDILAHGELLDQLTRREIKARYKDSALGFFWSLAKPLTMLLVYYVAIGKFLGAQQSPGHPDGIPNYALFIFSGLTAWQLFSDIVIIGTGSIVGNGALIKKVYVPREVFPLSVVGSALFNFSIQLGILIAATAVFGEFPTGMRWGYAVLALVLLLLLATGLAFLFSGLNVYLRDVAYLVEISLMILMWASPIVYSVAQVDKSLHGNLLEKIYLLNPLTLITLAFQKTFWIQGDGRGFFPNYLGRDLVIEICVAMVLLWFSQRVFSRLQSNFAQEL
ncbi:ABC transporter permease [Pengzhenrongella sp.]|jgi:ABC-2 type transport system permease protein|uniref:ABC transporter permease n=1 Tax=Pengzhenrongella sp. TaxID=2888820 RepID=UPI002F927B9C